MRKIRIVCDAFGKIQIFDERNQVFSNENELVQITVSYPNDYQAYRKRVDIFLTNDKSMDFIEDDVANEFTFELGKEHLKQGLVKIQPIAYLIEEEGWTYEETKKQKWQVFSLEVINALNVDDSTVNVSNTLGYDLQVQIDDINDELNLIAESIETIGDDLTDLQEEVSNLNHNYLVNLQGGLENEYYHLTLAQYNKLVAFLATLP